MDYPKSEPGVALLNGKFTDGNPLLGIPASLDPSSWANAVTDELLNVIIAAGLDPSENESDQLLRAIRGGVSSVSSNTALTATEAGMVLIDAGAGTCTVTLPDAGQKGASFIVRRVDNSGNRLKVQALGTDRIKFHTHLNPTGYSFLVLMGAGDWWHLRSDGQGGWWPVGRHDSTPLGRPVFETTTAFAPGGYGPLSGAEFQRADWPWLWDHAQQSGMLTTEAGRIGMEGGWTSGDGVLTFRGPEGRAEFLRILDDGRGIDSGRPAGSWRADELRAHSHVYTKNGATFASTNGSAPADALRAPDAGARTSDTGGSETRPRSIAYPGRIKLI